MTISLPPHRADRFRDILAEITATQKRISVDKWHLYLVELRSMWALADFQWLTEDMASRPTRLFELVPLTPTLDDYHNSSGRMCRVVVLPGPSDVPCVLQKQPSASLLSKDKLSAHPIVWRVPYPQDVFNCLVTYKNPGGDINNSDLELAGGVFQYFCAADCYDVRERTVLSHTDNSAGMWWTRKGSATCTYP